MAKLDRPFFPLSNWWTGLREILKYSILHPQWQANTLHRRSRQCLDEIRNMRVLDIGSGNADYNLHRSNQHLRLDYPETGQYYSKRPDVYGDARKLPLKTESMDVVLLLEVLEHIPDTESTIHEIRRVLKDGGMLYLSVPFIYPAHDLPHDYFRFSIAGASHLLQKNGFSVELVQVHGNSMVTILQLFNLVLLEPVRYLVNKNYLLAAVCLSLVYPLCFLNNLFGVPVKFLKWDSRLYLGCFLKAVVKDE